MICASKNKSCPPFIYSTIQMMIGSYWCDLHRLFCIIFKWLSDPLFSLDKHHLFTYLPKILQQWHLNVLHFPVCCHTYFIIFFSALLFCLCVSEHACFQDAPLWLTTGSSNQESGKVATFPFPQWPPPHPSPPTIEIPVSHYWLWGLKVNPIFQPSLSLFLHVQIRCQRLKPPVT